MRSLGVRPVTGGARWVVVEGTRAAPQRVNFGKIDKPKTFDDAHALKNLREELLAVIAKYGVAVVAVRDNDAARSAKRFYPRVRAEAIALEAAAASGKSAVLLGWASIASVLGIAKEKGKKAKYKVASKFRGIDCADLDTEQVDALHAAVAGLRK